MKTYYVYILSSKKNGTLYTGMTSDIVRRVFEHKNNLLKGFTEKYKVHDLVYLEETDDVSAAMQRERRLKKWKRSWKIKLIESKNPQWRDLYEECL